MNHQLHQNLNKLESFKELKYNWNGNITGVGADPFNPTLIDKTKGIISDLDIQPLVFPTACDSIQFEYHRDDLYLEIEISENKIEIFKTVGDFIIFEKEISSFEVNKYINNSLCYPMVSP